MKTAISIPDPIFKSAEKLAKRLGLSRSELYVRALSKFLEENNGEKVTDLLDEIYGNMENQGLDEEFKKAQMKSLHKDKW